MQSRMPEGYSTREQVEALLAEAREAAAPQAGGRGRARLRKRRTGTQRVLHALANALYAVLVAALLVSLYVGIQARMHDQPASLLGYSLYQVKTGSMVPTLPIGSFIVTSKPEDASRIAAGTVVTFRTTEGAIITHRVIEVVEDGGVKYRTKGDNPINSPDLEFVTPDRVLGTLRFSVSLPRLWEEPS